MRWISTTRSIMAVRSIRARRSSQRALQPPTCLAACPGRGLLLAVSLGLDVSCRVALASTLDRGWHRTAAMGVFGAAAASGKLLGLTVEQMVNALGIAFSQAAGNRQCIVDGALTKRLQAGQAASSGVFAAILAAEGFTGAQNIFLGRFGFFELYQPNGHDAAKLLEGLGREFRGDELSFKPYACGRPQHAMLDAAIAAREQLGLESAAGHCGDRRSIGKRVRCDHRRQFRWRSPQAEAYTDCRGAIRAALSHSCGADTWPRWDYRGRRHPQSPCAGDCSAHAGHCCRPPTSGLTVQLRDGRSAAVTLGKPLGSPTNPLSIQQLKMKFADCARNAVRPLPDEVVRDAAESFLRLESISNVSTLLRQFA